MTSTKQHCVTVLLNDIEWEALEKRMDYLRGQNSSGRVTRSDAIRHAVMSTGYTRQAKKNADQKTD